MFHIIRQKTPAMESFFKKNCRPRPRSILLKRSPLQIFYQKFIRTAILSKSLRAGVAVYLEDLQKQPPQVFYKKAVLKNFALFTGKNLCWSLILLKTFRPTILLIRYRCFPVNISKFLRTSILKNIHERLLLG